MFNKESSEKKQKNARIIDMHSHLLPSIDDGSSSVDMSLQILSSSYNQKIRKMVATPHFYPMKTTLSTFLEKREESIKKLLPFYSREKHPIVYVGAEVAFFPSFGECEDLKKLTILGTNTLMVEMPFSQWSDSMINSLLKAKESFNLNIIIAHIERYIDFQKKNTLETLIKNKIVIQSNAEHFIENRKKSLKELKNGFIHILGSDTHNMDSRPQRIEEAKEIIKKYLGEEYIEIILNNTKPLLSGAYAIDTLYEKEQL